MLPLRSLLNAVYAALADGRNTDQLRELDEQLEEQPKGQPRRSTSEEKKNLAAVMGLMKAQGR